jgi:hypothetical protein
MNERYPYDPRSLHLMYTVLLLMQLMLTLVVIYVAGDSVGISFDFNGLLSPISVPIMSLLLALMGRSIWRNGMDKISKTEDINDKLELLTKIHIYQWAMVQFGTILLLTFTLVEANFYYFIFSLVNIIYFFTLRPKIFSLTGGV